MSRDNERAFVMRSMAISSRVSSHGLRTDSLLTDLTIEENETDRLIAGCELVLSPLPHSSGLHHRDGSHAPKAAGRAQPSALLSDPVSANCGHRCDDATIRAVSQALPGSIPDSIFEVAGRRSITVEESVDSSLNYRENSP
jgi:hypothetical protein